MGRIVSIDYGTKRVGLAVTDPLQIFATGLDVVHSKDIIEFLLSYDKKEGIESFVVGHAKKVDNTDSDSMQHINPFVNKLRKLFPDKNIEMIDERFTSVIAQKAILDAGIKKMARRNKERVDLVSAVLILQTFLEKRSNLL
jgi:putative Holliday junction resolvase